MEEYASDRVFSGMIPGIYDALLVPLIFEPYAVDIASRAASLPARRVLEIAAGTGVATRALARSLPGHVPIIATDLNQPMIDLALAHDSDERVTWRQADAMDLPFDDESFDLVVCQFGVMFFPDKQKAFAEARRVLRPGGTFLFNTWDRIEANDFANVVTAALAPVFPDDPPRFLARKPHGYSDREQIRQDIASGGFTAAPVIESPAARSRAATCDIPAVAYIHGTPLRAEVVSRDESKLTEATNIASEAIARQFGRVDVEGSIRAHVVSVVK